MSELWFFLHRYLDRMSLPGNGHNRMKRYGFVVVICSILFIFKTLLTTALEIDVPFLFSLFIVILSAWYGGMGPGIFATLLSGGITYVVYLEPKYSLFGPENVPNAIVMFVFILEGFFISVMSETHRKSDIKKTEFIGVISHELKNPLTSIKGYAELILKSAKSTNDKKLVDYSLRIDQQVTQVIYMVNEMLDITKIETGRLTYHDELFFIQDLVSEVVADQQVATSSHTLHVQKKGKKVIRGDRYRIGQVISNLINNAVKYSPQGKVVNVHVENKKSSVLISVQDFGSGISNEDQKKLFQAYFRAKNTQSTKGTGIGLFISSQIIKRHKGKLWVKSTIGKGTTFFLRLPTNRSK